MFKTITRTVKQIPDTTCGAYCITNECRVFELHLIGTTSTNAFGTGSSIIL